MGPSHRSFCRPRPDRAADPVRGGADRPTSGADRERFQPRRLSLGVDASIQGLAALLESFDESPAVNNGLNTRQTAAAMTG